VSRQDWACQAIWPDRRAIPLALFLSARDPAQKKLRPMICIKYSFSALG
jgi:hypothetical protein